MGAITRLYLTNVSAPGLVTKTAVYSADDPIDVSVIPRTAPTNPATGPSFSNATLCIHVGYLDPGITASLALQQYVGVSTFAATPVFVAHFLGALGAQVYPLNSDGSDTCSGAAASVLGATDQVVRIPWYDIRDAQFGVANAQMRLDLVGIHTSTGYTTNHSIEYEAWLEY
jgi:hypothetical protein